MSAPVSTKCHAWDHRCGQPTPKAQPSTLHPSVVSLCNALDAVPVVVAHNPYSWSNPEVHYSVLPSARTSIHKQHSASNSDGSASLPPSPMLRNVVHVPDNHGLSSDDECGSNPSSDGPCTPQHCVPTDDCDDRTETFDVAGQPCDAMQHWLPEPSPALGHMAGHAMHWQWSSVPTVPANLKRNPMAALVSTKAAQLPTTVTHVQYMRLPCLMRGPTIRFGESCSTALAHLPRVKLGGVCCELKPLMVAYIIYLSTGIVVAGVDMFTNHKGCCSVWVYEANDVQRMQETLDQRMWMLPCSLRFCLMATNTAARHALEALMHEVTASHKKLHFPTHLLTVQLYVRIPPTPRFSVQHTASTDDSKRQTKPREGTAVVLVPIPQYCSGAPLPRDASAAQR